MPVSVASLGSQAWNSGMCSASCTLEQHSLAKSVTDQTETQEHYGCLRSAIRTSDTAPHKLVLEQILQMPVKCTIGFSSNGKDPGCHKFLC